MRHHAKIDDNQPDIVLALRSMGCSVQSLATVGKGCPDLLVGYRGRNLLMEVKDGEKAKSAQRLTKDESKWHYDWQGDVVTVNSAAMAMHVVTSTDRSGK